MADTKAYYKAHERLTSAEVASSIVNRELVLDDETKSLTIKSETTGELWKAYTSHSAAPVLQDLSVDSIKIVDLTASYGVLTGSSKELISVALTGTGSLVMASGASLTSPTITTPSITGGTISSASLSGTIANTATITGGTLNPSVLQQGGVQVATISGIQTLTNKTFNLTSNSLSGTLAQFNDALSDANFVSLTGVESLSNKTLVAPTISSPSISSASITGATLNATITNSGTISGGTINATTLQQGGVQAVTTSGSQTLTNKSISGTDNTLSNIGNGSLSNSSLTIGSTSVSLGGTAATVAGLTLTSPVIGTSATLPGSSVWNTTGIGYGVTPTKPLDIILGGSTRYRTYFTGSSGIHAATVVNESALENLSSPVSAWLNSYNLSLGTLQPLNYSASFNQVRIGGAGVMLTEAATSGGALRLRYNGYYDGTNRSINASERVGEIQISGEGLVYTTAAASGSIGGAYSDATSFMYNPTKEYLKLGSTYGTGYNNWSTNYTKLLVGSSGALWANNSADNSGSVIMSYNTYFDGTNFRGVYDGNGTRFDASSERFAWLTYAGTTAGAIMTGTERMRLDVTGLGIGNNSPNALLTVGPNITPWNSPSAVIGKNSNTSQATLQVRNISTGSASVSVLDVGNDSTNHLFLRYFPSTFTTDGILLANMGQIGVASNASNGLLVSTNGNHSIRFSTNGLVRAAINSSGLTCYAPDGEEAQNGFTRLSFLNMGEAYAGKLSLSPYGIIETNPSSGYLELSSSSVYITGHAQILGGLRNTDLSGCTVNGSGSPLRWRGELAADPANPMSGDMYFNTSDGAIKLYAESSYPHWLSIY